MSMRSDEFNPIFSGRFSDGRSAAAVTAEVRLTERGVEIRRTNTIDVLLWPYGALTSATPLGRHSIDALLGYKFASDSTLFVGDGTFARQLQDHAPHLSVRATRLRHATPWLWAAAAIASLVGVIWLMELSPARAIARMLPDSTRAALGARVIGSMTSGRKMCDSVPGRRALDQLAGRLSKAAGGNTPFKIVVVDWGLVNAFAAPGEQIVLTRGLLEKSESPDEVAGVLSHEMGHGIEMHPESGIVRAIGLSAAMDLILGGSGGTLANIGLVLAQLSYTRSAERHADAHAIRILREAAISPTGLANFFRRIDKLDGGGKASPEVKDKPKDWGKTSSAFDVLRTHPQSAERAAIVANQPPYKSTPALSAADWSALRAICLSEGKI